ncbi:enoyl-CoA hydratase/isomerase family protein [Desulfoluna butyratoxydans]|uniref:Crotonase superfamily n=1 Tax=Desulfoluna butyratoxydans TaxID=231438 RepID=A0A4U8YLN1_9BACT|nr:enoyl-CoA hydratase/isomerase family protein [Desulfoluna butyratoxydans]VFQ44885.1 crotonase superfamily [Desulfoluna butyratoxydans]
MFENRSGDTPIFSCYRSGAIVLLQLKNDLVNTISEIDIKELMFDYFKRFTSDASVKVIILMGAKGKKGRDEYIDFYRKVACGSMSYDKLERLYCALNQFILKLATVNKYVIHADRGQIDTIFLSMALACDYRILATGSVYQNPYHNIGLVPKGGLAYFLPRMIGSAAASKFLLRKDDITAKEALGIKIVDRIVPPDRLEQETVNMARSIAEVPAETLFGVKKLLNLSQEDLHRVLEVESIELRRIVRSDTFRQELSGALDRFGLRY